MAKTTIATVKREKTGPALLGPGLHLVTLDLGAAGEARVRTLDGRCLSAFVSEDVAPELVAECRRGSRPMIACDTPRGPTIVGALQTQPSITREPDGTLVLEGKRVRIAAKDRVLIEAGEAAQVSLEASGKARIVGDRMVIDVSSNVRVLSALVELP
jgi:hypothetical protein